MPCQNGGRCINLNNSFKCRCLYGYYGLKCQSYKERPCILGNKLVCLYGGKCSIDPVSLCVYACVCVCMCVSVCWVCECGGGCVRVCGSVRCVVSGEYVLVCDLPLAPHLHYQSPPSLGPYLTPTMAPITSWVGCPALAIHSPRVKTVRTCTILATKPVVQIKLNA